MSVVINKLRGLVLSTAPNAALNPVLTASLLWVLTKAPSAIRDRLFDNLALLRDPKKLSTIIKTLKWLLVLGLIGNVNRRLNKIALNAWRIKGEKKKWQFNKEIAVVTGGCSGIGELVVKGLVKKGVKVAVLDIQQLPLSLQNHANIKFFACDITNPEAVRSTAEAIRSSLGSPTILVNNAGVAEAHTILDTSDEYLRKIFDVNLLSNFSTVKAFLPDMVAKNKGHIVTVASLASFVSLAGMTDYCATKAGVLAFHEGLNQEIKHQYKAPGVITTSIHPSWVRTPLIKTYQDAIKAGGDRLIEPSTVANRIVEQIFNAEGGQVLIPKSTRLITLARGWPNWLQEPLRDSTSKMILKSL